MKQKVITFKVDPEIEELLNKIPNKSDFIRNSILKAMDCICPLCSGTGILNANQKEHWDKFQEEHQVIRCHDCDELYIKCNHESKSDKGV